MRKWKRKRRFTLRLFVREKQKSHDRSSGRNRAHELDGFKGISLPRPFVQYPLDLFIGHGARFNDFVGHGDIIENVDVFFND